MRAASLLAMAVAMASSVQAHKFYTLPKTTEGPPRKKGKVSHKQQARKAKRRNK